MIISTFKRHGAETIDTPVFELKEVSRSFVRGILEVNHTPFNTKCFQTRQSNETNEGCPFKETVGRTETSHE